VQSRAGGGEMENIFTEIYENNTWSSGESVSGNGSTLAYTSSIRNNLINIFNDYGIKTILDGPCGDFNWMKHVLNNTQISKYYGADIVKPLIDKLQAQYGSHSIEFIYRDLTRDTFPTVDLMLCRDCLFHLSYEDTYSLLNNFVQSKTKFLLTTTMYNNDLFENSNIQTGGFRRIDLFSPPYNFTKKILTRIDDSHESEPETRRELVLWSRSDIEAAVSQFALS